MRSETNITTLKFPRTHRDNNYPFAVQHFRRRRIGPIISMSLVLMVVFAVLALSQIHP